VRVAGALGFAPADQQRTILHRALPPQCHALQKLRRAAPEAPVYEFGRCA
jgi:hypothetical protein